MVAATLQMESLRFTESRGISRKDQPQFVVEPRRAYTFSEPLNALPAEQCSSKQTVLIPTAPTL